MIKVRKPKPRVKKHKLDMHEEAIIKRMRILTKHFREYKGWTMEELGEKVGHSQSFISKLETGSNDAEPRATTWFKMCKVLVIDPTLPMYDFEIVSGDHEDGKRPLEAA